MSSIISALTPTAAPHGAVGSTTTIPSPHAAPAGFSTMESKPVSGCGASGVPEDGGGGGGGGHGKQGSGGGASVKRQRAAGAAGGDISGPPRVDEAAPGDQGEGGNAGSSSEQQLREQLRESTRRMAEMMKEMARLREQLAAHEARGKGVADGGGAGAEAMEQESPPAEDGRGIPPVWRRYFIRAGNRARAVGVGG